MSKMTEIVKMKLETIYSTIDKIVDNNQKAVVHGELEITAALEKAEGEINGIIAEKTNLDFDTLIYVQGLIGIIERFGDTVFSEMASNHLTDIMANAGLIRMRLEYHTKDGKVLIEKDDES